MRLKNRVGMVFHSLRGYFLSRIALIKCLWNRKKFEFILSKYDKSQEYRSYVYAKARITRRDILDGVAYWQDEENQSRKLVGIAESLLARGLRP